MDYISALLLGIVQGLTEFLPVSSSGHLVLGQKLLGIELHDLSFDIVVHVATLLVVLFVYRRLILDILRDLILYAKTLKMNPGTQLFLYVCVASIPTAVLGLFFKDQFELLFSNIRAVALALAFTGILLFVTKFLKKQESQSLSGLQLSSDLVADFSYWKVILIGLAQGLAITPGISRSGSTIAVALLLGVRSTSSSMFSFLVAVPAILGASILQLRKLEVEQLFSAHLVLGFLASFVFGYLGLKWILIFVKKQRLELFSFYLWALALGVFLLSI